MDITPVNLFRVLLPRSLGVALDPLPNRSFFSTYEDLYSFQEITELLASPGNEGS